MSKPKGFQQLISTLQDFWSAHGCAVLQPYDMPMGAGTFHWSTSLATLGPKPWRVALVQPCRRPADGRYGENPNRLQYFHQFQVILKPSPVDVQEVYLESLRAIGLDPVENDIRFVEDDWEGPTLGASGLGWEVWCNGLEITQFTYFQQMGGMPLASISAELTYGLERISMSLQGKENVYDLSYNGQSGSQNITYGDVFLKNEQQFSAYNFEAANTDTLFRHFEDSEEECRALLKQGLTLPAYDQCILASHTFNLLQARGCIGVSERAQYVARVRALAKACCTQWMESEAETVLNSKTRI